MITISFINQKGGTGKTTSCINIGARLAQKGYRVLLVDTDPQGSLGISLAIDTDNHDTLYEVLQGEANVKDAIQKHNNYDILPTCQRQTGTESEFAENTQLLKTMVVDKLKKSYDFILIDCPPELSIFSLMSLAASTAVIIPLEAKFLSFGGIINLRETLENVKRDLNPKLEVLGYVFTMFDTRINHYKQVVEQVESLDPGKIFKIKISNNIALAEAPAYSQDIFEYSPKSKGAVQYTALTAEILERLGIKEK